MSPLAQILRHSGNTVRGSDRNRDRGQSGWIYDRLETQGMALYPQNGSGVAGVDEMIVSSAVEEDNPDVGAARKHGIPIRKRADVLAELFNRSDGVAVGGTSGKTTVTGMVGHILRATGQHPTVVNGGIMLDAAEPPGLGNAICGSPDLMVIEADESDGTIALYKPSIAVLTNISLDHKSLDELRTIFGQFVGTGEAAVVNLDCPESVALRGPDSVTFGVENQEAAFFANRLELLPGGAEFDVSGVRFRLRLPGRHNVANAVAALAACALREVPLNLAADALAEFRGIKRRLQVLGQAHGVTVIDDFAHNPDKIRATLAALRAHPGRLLVVFQPTGFGPTRFLRDGLIAAFSHGLGVDDLLLMPEIYYAGGTAVKDISSRDIIDAVHDLRGNAVFLPERAAILKRLVAEAGPDDRIVIMGARDDTLTDFAETVLAGLVAR